jgi:hypothetical protein
MGNHAMGGMILITAILLATVIGVAPLRQLFGFEIPGLPTIIVAAGIGAIGLSLLLAYKAVMSRIGLFPTASRHESP